MPLPVAAVARGSLCGRLLLLAFLAFFANIVMSVGLRGVVGTFTRSRVATPDLVPAA